MGGMGGMGGMPGMGGMSGMGGMGGMQEKKRPFNALDDGTRVRLQGLQKKPEMNGNMGIIEGYDHKTGRYIVKDIENQTSYKLKMANLQQNVVGAKITGMTSSQEFNGTKGTIIGYTGSEGRYWFRLPRHVKKKPAAVRPANVILPANTVVRIIGLTKAPQLNGKWARIKEFEQSTGRYIVQISPQKSAKLKLGNVVASSN
mmetsp:Transcript_14497/g.27373  ORF Transcript_14497/g.27373 Transcript_14497/m.27373 type:complete len:201 (-) Transcript_14497:185-787(-)